MAVRAVLWTPYIQERHGTGRHTSDTDDLSCPPKHALRSRTGLSPLDSAQLCQTNPDTRS